MIFVKAVKYLIEKKHVKVLMGFRTWEAAAFSVDFSNRARVPMLSLAGEIPAWASREWPFYICASHSQRAQMKAAVAIVQSWRWRRVTIIYEDTRSASEDIIPYLINGLKDADVLIEQLAPLSPWLVFSDRHYLHRELESLKEKESRVFIVHTSVKLASSIFVHAKKMGMMESESAWIVTSAIANQLDLLKETTISSMQGVLGIKSYLPDSGDRFKRFADDFEAQFKSAYPNESYKEPGLYALQANDAVRALALATNHIANKSTMSSESLVDKIYNSNFAGLFGEFKFSRGRLKPQKIFRIIQVAGKSYKHLGYWSDGLGFSSTLMGMHNYTKFMTDFKQLTWSGPGGNGPVPRGYAMPTDANPLLIGVPTNPAFDDFVKVHCDNSSCKNPSVTGFSFDVFNATRNLLPYKFPYKFVPYNGTYDEMIQEIQKQTFQAVIGDTSIVSKRCHFAQFTPPYTETGLHAVVLHVQKHQNQTDRAWQFIKPFEPQLWLLTGLVNVYNGFVVWLIERRHTPAFRGSFWNQIGTLATLAFTTLFSLQGGNLHSNMSRMTMVVWLFVALVVTQSYTASLSSRLTVQRLSNLKVDINELVANKYKVGCNGNSFVCSYLKVLKFREEDILKVYRVDEYPQLLRNGTIKAAFLITPYVKIFLAKYCNGFASAEPTYKIGGFGFVRITHTV